MNLISKTTALARYAVIVRYGISGTLAAATNLGITALLAAYTTLHYLVIVSISFVFSVVISFVLQKFFTFRERHSSPTHTQFAIFVALAVVNLCVNDSIVYLLVKGTGVRWLVLNQAIASLAIACYSFFLYRYGIFRRATTNES